MKKAWTENNTIRDICPGDPLELYHQEVAQHYTTDVPDDVENGWVLSDNVWAAPVMPEPVIPPVPVPQHVTRRQARQALLLNGVLDKVMPALNAIPDPLQKNMAIIEWEDSQVFERNRPLVVTMGAALGMSSLDLDNLFITAGGL